MLVRRRAYGIETEYGCMLKENGKILASFRWPNNFLRSRIYRSADRQKCIAYATARLWHSNGSLSYVDTGDHPEHSSPEVQSVRDAVIYSQAGDRLMRDLFRNAYNDTLDVLLFRNNIASGLEGGIVTFGCHENYLAYLGDKWDAYNQNHFIPFVVSRQILDGTGSWDNKGEFFLSQRARCVGCWSNVPMQIAIKISSGLPRVHLIYGDSNMLDMSAFLKVGTTSLVLSLLEEGLLPDVTCVDPMITLRNISKGGPHERVMYMHNGKSASAHEIQVRYWEAARRALAGAMFDSDDVAAESELILKRWEQALNAIASNDIKWMLGRIDWATKQWLAEQEIMRRNHCDAYAAAEIRNTVDLMYHSIADACMRERIHGRFPERRLVTDEEITFAMSHPPVGTRASMRGAIVRAAIDHSMQYTLVSFNWHLVSVNTDKGLCEFRMDNPLNSYEASLAAIKNMFDGSQSAMSS